MHHTVKCKLARHFSLSSSSHLGSSSWILQQKKQALSKCLWIIRGDKPSLDWIRHHFRGATYPGGYCRSSRGHRLKEGHRAGLLA